MAAEQITNILAVAFRDSRKGIAVEKQAKLRAGKQLRSLFDAAVSKKRERDAKIAESYDNEHDTDGVALLIAAEIRREV